MCKTHCCYLFLDTLFCFQKKKKKSFVEQQQKLSFLLISQIWLVTSDYLLQDWLNEIRSVFEPLTECVINHGAI